MTRRREFFIAGTALAMALAAAIAIVALATCGGGSRPSASAGEVIFRTGRDSDGRPVPRSGEVGGMMGGGMKWDGCADCHGIEARGATMPMFAAPDITYANLTDSKGMLLPDGSRGPSYTDAAIRRAVTYGVDPDGDKLDWPMPRWRLSDTEWADLLAHLKTLR